MFESHHAVVVLLEPERLHLKLQPVVLGPRQELRAGACELTVKQTPERTTDRKVRGHHEILEKEKHDER